MVQWNDILTPPVLALLGLVSIPTLIQVAPIKVNPWSWLARTVGRALNANVVEEIKAVNRKVDKLSDEYHEGKAMNDRVQILRFGDEVLRGRKHTKGHYDEILRSISYYDKYCEEHPDFENGVTGPSAEGIKRRYRELWDSNGFLKEGDRE